MIEDLETGVLEYKTVEEFLEEIKKDFGGKDDKSK